MASVGVFILPPGFTLNNLKKKIARRYAAAKPSDPHSWSLSQHLFRSLPISGNPVGSQTGHDDLQLITLSAYPSHLFVHSSIVPKVPNQAPQYAAGEDVVNGNTVALPSSDSSTTLMSLLAQKLNTVWQPVKSQSLEILDGRAWDVGIFNLAAGEVFATGSGTRQSRGLVLAIKLNSNFESGQTQKRTSGISSTDSDEIQTGSLDPGESEELRNEREENTRFLIREFATILGINGLSPENTANSASFVVGEDNQRAVEQFWQIGAEHGAWNSAEQALERVADGSILWGSADGWEAQVEFWARVMKSKHLTLAMGRRV